MINILLIVIVTLLSYMFVLARKTVISFKKEQFRVSYFSGLMLTSYIFIVHFKIAWENKSRPKFVLFVCKQYFLRFDISLAVLVEFSKEHFSVQKKSNVKKQSKSFWIKRLKSRTNRDEYSDILQNQCFA
ncbi:hypothetical protein AB6878_12635 [Carnobacterium maltaromaticum]|uniref:hypothetical protein n=1 Tax=Carnobacterium maltaromaticum TaxID=2751 RepID=UPI0039BE3B4E